MVLELWSLCINQQSYQGACSRGPPVAESPTREGDRHGHAWWLFALLYRRLGGQQPVPGYVTRVAIAEDHTDSSQVLAGKTPNIVHTLSPMRYTQTTWRDTHWALIMLPLRRLLSRGNAGVRRVLWRVVKSRAFYTRKVPKAGTIRVCKLVSLSARRPRFLRAKRSMVSESKVHQDQFASTTPASGAPNVRGQRGSIRGRPGLSSRRRMIYGGLAEDPVYIDVRIVCVEIGNSDRNNRSLDISALLTSSQIKIVITAHMISVVQYLFTTCLGPGPPCLLYTKLAVSTTRECNKATNQQLIEFFQPLEFSLSLIDYNGLLSDSEE